MVLPHLQRGRLQLVSIIVSLVLFSVRVKDGHALVTETVVDMEVHFFLVGVTETHRHTVVLKVKQILDRSLSLQGFQEDRSGFKFCIPELLLWRRLMVYRWSCF